MRKIKYVSIFKDDIGTITKMSILINQSYRNIYNLKLKALRILRDNLSY